jgi:hypothetical protein
VLDLDGQIHPLFTQDSASFLLHDRACAVVWVDDLVADFVQALSSST